MAFQGSCALCSVSGQALGEAVVVNEFMASNDGSLLDGDGNASDWVEIWNPATEPVELRGWHLSDDRSNLHKWPLPQIDLGPDEYLVIFASGQEIDDYRDPTGNFHTNFRLDKAKGGYLALVRPSESGGDEVVSEFSDYPAQREDISYGRYGTSQPLDQGYFRDPTPGLPNGLDVFEGFVADTRFSHHRGYYERSFRVTITTDTPGATIRYTTDGSAPTLTNGADYPHPSGISIHGTTTLRAAAFRDGYEPTNIDTQTYLFPGRVPDQPSEPPGFPTTWPGWDYGMDQDPAGLQDIVGDSRAEVEDAKAVIADALQALPTLSVVMDVDDLFGTRRGIYHNTEGRGMEWERPCSVELIDPERGGLFQVDCGIRMQGFTSRNPSRNPKHSLRLAFRKSYGAGKLRYPLFGAGAADEFDTIVLRSNSQDAWVYDSASNRVGQFVRDEWTRQTHLAMGRPSPHGTWVHLYLNGLYWGVYNPVERPDASFMASYFGGDKDDQDALKNHEEVLDGDGRAYAALLGLIQNDPNNFNAGYRDFTSSTAYQAVQGNQPDGTPDPRRPDYLDVLNLIDYMIPNMYAAATDWPGNNYIGRDRTRRSTGFKFFSWDNEHGLKPSVTVDRTLPHSRDHDSPTKFHHALRSNAEYRLLFADRLHRAFFNDGPLTPENAAARWLKITGEIEEALVAESARWGDYRRANPYTVEGDFKPLRQSLLDTWFPQRTGIVLRQFRAQGLYPELSAPAFSQHGGTVAIGHRLEVNAPEGAVYVTLDGSDPRLPGGAISPGATPVSGGGINLTISGTVKARALHNDEWSALNEANFVVGTPADHSNLAISEIHYKPIGGGDLEFVEVMNAGPSAIDLTGVRFSEGIHFSFPTATTLAPGERLLVVDDAAAFRLVYGDELPVAGEFSGNLDNDGDTITLLANDDEVIASFHYDDASPWPESPDTGGYSLTLMAPDRNPDPSNPANWRASVTPGGSPGGSDAVRFSGDAAGDLDRDGRPALLEYALGSSDTESDGDAPFHFQRSGTRSLVISFRYNLAADDAILTLESSPDLQEWNTAPSVWVVTGRENLGAGQGMLTLTMTRDDAEAYFVRLRATLRK